MNTLPERDGSQEALFDKFKESIFADLHVATIGIVTALDADTGLPTVKPIINQRVVASNGSTYWMSYTEIPDTPYIGEAPAIGSAVLLIFCDHDISGYLDSTGVTTADDPNTINQEILRSHNLANAVAITGLTQSSSAAPATTYAPIVGYSTTDNGSGVSNALVFFLESYEGCVLDWYDDGFGNLTIGYGHTGDLPSGWTAPLTPETAETLLQYDLTNTYIPIVQSTFTGYTLSQNQFDALVSFVYNLGSVYPDMEAAVKGGTTGTAMKEVFDEYCHAKGKVVQGLLKRRDAEWAMYNDGNYQI
ncbi:MAG: glycoside hydrolase family protein [Oscillospiraceae bacterium]|nr:glycoside hydrolase family protein [Oscillospiraceae bacterium]